MNTDREILLGFAADALLYAFYRSFFIHQRILGEDHPDMEVFVNMALDLTPKLGGPFGVESEPRIF